ncbi:hypothetical protein VTK73DRAFT_3222 [Phialemonium thermophilum]|uniref:ABM domain-containing protein n=1 Tax=Phialemonium thermophilum TaxID=223376 RepID=A0ABR3Y846_9PEZI
MNRALHDAILAIKRAEGSQSVFFGRQLEDPRVGVLAVVWSSVEAAASLTLQSYGTTGRKVLPLAPRSGAVASLQAGATEVFTGYGVEPGFEANVRDFAKKLDAESPPGYHGGAVGAAVALGRREEGYSADDGEEVKLVIGWDSKEAHLRAKDEPGAIKDNIHLLRTLRKKVDMWHVNFEEQ